MPTEKPRITITVPEDMMREIDDYRYGNRISTQTQAIFQLVRLGLDIAKAQKSNK